MAKHNLSDDLQAHFANLESEYKLPNGLLKAVAKAESAFNPNAVSPKGAQGMFQFMPETAKEYKVDVNDPVSSANGAAKYYSNLLRMYDGDIDKALAGYNWGQGNVNKKGMDNAPAETRNYIAKIKGFMGNNTTEKKSELSADEFPPELWAAYHELKALKANGSQASLAQQDLSQSKTVSSSHASKLPEDEFTPEQWAAYHELKALKAQQQAPQPAPQQAVAPVQMPRQPALNPNGGMPPVNPVQAVQGNPNGAQNVLATQAQGINFQQPAQSGEQIGQALVGTMMKINDPEKIAEYMRTKTPSQQLFIKNELAKQAKLNPAVQASGLSNFIEGFGRVGRDMRLSVEQAGNYVKSKITGDDSGLQAKNREIANAKTTDELIDTIDPSKARFGGEIAGNVATAIGAPVGKLVTSGASLASKVLGSRAGDLALKGAGASVLAQPVVNKGNPENTDFVSGKLQQAGLGAALGAGVGKTIDVVAGKLGKPLTAKLTAADELAQKKAKEQGITLLASELPSARMQPGLVKQGQNYARDNDTVREVVTKNEQAALARAQELGNDIGKIDKSTYLQNKGLDKVLADTKNKYHYAAKEIDNKLNSLDINDPNAVLKVASEANYLSRKIANGAEYDEVAKLAPVGYKLELPSANAVLKTAKEEMAKMNTPELKKQFGPVIKNIEESLKKGKFEYTDADQLFKEFGVLARQSVKAGDDNAARIYNDLKKAINNDKDTFVNSLPSDPKLMAYKTAYNKAKTNNMNNIQNIKNDSTLRNLMEPFNKNGNPNLPDNLISNLVKKGKVEQVKTLFNSIDDDAKNAIQSGVFNKILAKAQTADGGFNPKAFNKAIRDYSDPANGNTPLNIVFAGPNGAKLKNLMEVFDNLNTVGFNRINPQTGVQGLAKLENLNRIVGLSGSLATNGLSLAPAVISEIRKFGISKFLTEPKYNKMLLDIKNTNPSSQKYIDKVSQLMALVTSQNTDNIGK